MITKTNYEIYLVDYIDGTLDEPQKEAVEAFLAKHPSIAEEFGIYQTYERLDAEHISYKNTDTLFKHRFECEDQLEEQIVAACEDDLDNEALEELMFFIENNSKGEALYKVHKQIKYTPDFDVVFPDQSKLIQKKRRAFALWQPLLAAASIAAAIIIIFKTDQSIPPNYASLKPIEVLEHDSYNPTIHVAHLIGKTDEIIIKDRVVIEKTNTVEVHEKLIAEATTVENEETFLEKPRVKGGQITKQNIITSYNLSTIQQIEEEEIKEQPKQDRERIGTIGVQKLTDTTLYGLKKISNEKFNYKTDDEGKVESIKLKIKKPQLPPLLAYNRK